MIKRINLGFVNCYLAKAGDGFVLFDTGIGSLRGKLLGELAAAGCTRDNLRLIVLTHGDIDHAGNCAFFQREYGCPVAMHAGDRAMVEKGDLGADREVRSAFMRAMQGLLKLFGVYGKMASGFETFTADLFLEEGQSLGEYGLEAMVAHIPGHTEGSLAALFASGECVSGDTLLKGKPAYLVADGAALRQSVERLAHSGVSKVYPGHGKPFRWPEAGGSPAGGSAAQSAAAPR